MAFVLQCEGFATAHSHRQESCEQAGVCRDVLGAECINEDRDLPRCGLGVRRGWPSLSGHRSSLLHKSTPWSEHLHAVGGSSHQRGVCVLPGTSRVRMCITSTLTSFCNNINMEAEVFNGQLCSKRNVRNRTGIGRLKHWEHVSSSCTNGLEHGAAYGDGGYRPQQRRLGYKVLFSATIFWTTDDVSSENPRLYDEGASEHRSAARNVTMVMLNG